MYIDLRPFKQFAKNLGKFLNSFNIWGLLSKDMKIAVAGIFVCLGIMFLLFFITSRWDNTPKKSPPLPPVSEAVSDEVKVEEAATIPIIEEQKSYLMEWMSEMKKRGWLNNYQGSTVVDNKMTYKFATQPIYWGEVQIDLVIFEINMTSSFGTPTITLYHDTGELTNGGKSTKCKYVDSIPSGTFFKILTSKKLGERANAEIEGLINDTIGDKK